LKKFFKIFFLIIIIMSSLIIAGFLFLNGSTGKIPANGIEFEIKKGDSASSIAYRLFYQGYIHSKDLFILTTRILNLDKNLKAGWIMLDADYNMLSIIHEIYKGDFITVEFTIPEGSTVNQVKEILINNNILDKKEIEEFFSDPDYTSAIGLKGMKSAEGFLFPDTYKFYKGSSAEKIFSSMVDLFYKKLNEIYPDYKNLSQKQLLSKIIMASIIEKEVRLQDESDIVAGVFYNRIKNGMKLQSCATVQYILGKPKEHLLNSDLEIIHPYNTYIYTGLPPGPICNPGFTALKSSFYPKKHNYLFFVVKDPVKGSHHFSATYSEHLAAQKKYKQIKGYK